MIPQPALVRRCHRAWSAALSCLRQGRDLRRLAWLLLWWCGGQALAQDAPLAPDPALTQVRVQLQWRHQWQFAGFYAALERGYYREAGLDVTLVEYQHGLDIVSEVLSGRAQFGTFYSGIVSEAMAGRPIRLLASYFQRSPLMLATQPDIYVPADLKGKRVMAESLEVHSANLHQMFARFGVKSADLTLIPHAFSIEPFARGEVDAMTVFTTNEVYALRKAGVPFNLIDPNDYGVPLYDLNLFTSTTYAQDNPGVVAALVAATRRGWEYALARPNELVDLILARYNTQGKDRDHLRFEAHQTHSAMLPEIYPIGGIDPVQLDRIQTLFVTVGLADHKIPLADLILAEPAAAPESAADTGAAETPERAAYVQAHPRLRVVFAPAAPYAYLRDGEPAGYTVDLMSAAARRAGFTLEARQLPIGEALAAVREGQADAVLNLVHAPERGAFLRYGRRTGQIHNRLYVRQGRPDLRTIADLARARVAVWPASPYAEPLRKRAPGVELVMVKDYADALSAVSDGRADATILESRVAAMSLAEQLITNVMDLGLADLDGRPWLTGSFFAVAQDQPVLGDILDQALDGLDAGEVLRLRRRWFDGDDPLGEAGAKVVLSAQERAWLAARGGRLTYCFSPVWTPFDYLQDGTHRGLFRDYLDLFGRLLGVHFDPLPSATWPQALQFAQERRCDLVSGAVRNAEREHYLAFTSPYITLTHVLVARDEAPFVPGLGSLAGKPIGVPAATAVYASVKASHPDQPLVEFENMDQMRDGILSGDMYAAAVTLEHAADLIRDWPGRFRVIGKLDVPYPIAVAVRNDEPLLLGIMQKAVDAVTQADRDQLAGRQTTFRLEQQIDLTHLWQALAVVALIAGSLLYRHRELTRLNRHLSAAKEAAEVADRAKGEFLANMSHELRTPLNAVLNLAYLGRDTQDPGRLHGYLAGVERSGRDLLRIIDEILDFSRLDAGALNLESAPFDLGDLMERVQTLTEPRARDKGLTLVCDLPPQLAGAWLGDARRLRQILLQLVGNAIKFTVTGEVRCLVSDGEPSGAGLCFRVRDTGIGIDPAQQGRLFAPFQQLDASSTRSQGGIGMGLVTVRRLVAAMGGRVEVSSRPGEGAEFRVTLPLQRVGEDAFAATVATASATGAAAGSAAGSVLAPTPARLPVAATGPAPLRVLAVEDDAVNRLVLVELLHRLGVAADTATNGIEALSRLHAGAGSYGLVLMDIQMPEMDGYAATRRLRADPELARLPVVALTAHALNGERQRCLAAGMDDYLTKPLDPHRLAAVVRHWLPVGAPALLAAGVADGMPVLVRPLAGRPGDADIAWLDPAQGLAFAGGDRELYRAVLETFCQAQRGVAEGLASDTTGIGGLKRLAHTLKGTAPMIGAVKLGRVAEQVDAALRPVSDQPAAPDGLADGLEAELAATLAQTLAETLAQTLTETLDAVTAWLGHAAGADSGQAQTGAADLGVADAGHRPRILLVDDEPSNLRLLVDVLGRDYEVTQVGDGPKALALALGEAPPDLILLDIGLPGMDGYEVCRRLKADPRGRDTPVIFVTARVGRLDERRGLALGALDYIHKPFDPVLVQARVRNHLALRQQGEALERLSSTDALTGIPNRRGFDRYLEDAWRRAVADGRCLGLLMMDIDAFKDFNDRYGHGAGDACLSAVGRTLSTLVTGWGGLAARYGGEEFVWVLPDTDLAQASAVADAALAAVRGLGIPHSASPCATLVTLSIGVAAARPADGGAPESLVDEADRRLYLAKNGGRNRVVA